MWKVGQLSFLYPRWSWPTLIYGIATGPKIAKILLFLCVLHTDFNVGKVMCFCIFILSRSFVFPFYRAGCLPADCTVDLNNFCSKLLSQHLHGLDIYLYQIIIYPIWPKCWHCHKRKGDQNCAILSFSFHIVNIWTEGLIREVFPIWFSRKLLNELFPDAEALQNCLFFLFLESCVAQKFLTFCEKKNYCSQGNRLSIRPNDEEYLVSKMDLKACLKYSWTEIAIPNSWLGRELFKAIPVYLFLTALIEPCLHDMCRCLLSSHLFMFDMCRCLFGS